MLARIAAKRIAVGVAMASIGGCMMPLPGFDNPLNPDIAGINAGEVVDSVKCAVNAYLIERATRVGTVERKRFRDAWTGALARAADQTDLDKERRFGLCARAEGWEREDPTKWRIVLEKWDGQAKRCRLTEIVEVPEKVDHTFFTQDDTTCRNDGAFRAFRYVEWSGDMCKRAYCPIGYEGKGNACAPKAQKGERFTLDPSSNAKIELTLTAFNTGSMNYQKIDATELGILRGIIVPGDSATGFPFPTLKATAKATNKVTISLVMAQGRYPEDAPEELVAKARALEDAWQAATEREKNARRKKGPPSPFYHLDVQLARMVPLRYSGEYVENCKAPKIEFLGLKDYIAKIVADQEAQVYKGAPETALDSIVLTSEFQLSMDATAGTTILRLLPVLQPPVLGLSPDHTHSLKLTFQGSKSRAFKSAKMNARQRCLDRMGSKEKRVDGKAPDGKKEYDLGTAFCDTPQAIYLEALIEAIENSKTAAN